MTVVKNKNTYSAKALADMGLAGLPTTKANVIALAKRESWAFVEVAGAGGKRREYTPPAYVLALIKARLVADLNMLPAVVQKSTLPVAHTGGETGLSLKQANVEGARRAVLAWIDRAVRDAGLSREKAMVHLLASAEMGTLDPFVDAALKLGLDARGVKGSDYPSVRTLKVWRKQELDGASLAPRGAKLEIDVPEWAAAFLAFYQQPQKPSVGTAYEMLIGSDYFSAKRLQNPLFKIPSIHQVRRLLDKMGNVAREVGRMGSREIKNLMPFNRRDFSDMQPNEVWSMDGHKFDAEVAHPKSKRAVRPEITLIVDVATRKAVGWSVGLAESAMEVLNAIRHGVVAHGIPAVLYVDNGSGYVNELIKDEAVGLMGRLGTTMHHSIAYNSQARGVIERLHGSVLVKAAKKMPTYIGKDMDRQAGQKVHKITRAASALMKKGVADAKTPLMPWDDFVEYVRLEIDFYNNRPHRSLGLKTPNEVWQMKTAAGFEAMTVGTGEANYMFRPQELRVVARGEICFNGKRYFSDALKEFHGDTVKMAYDYHDASQVWVYSDDDMLICTAQLNGNVSRYFAQTESERAIENRVNAQIKRKAVQIEELHAQNGISPMLEMGEAQTLEIPGLMGGDKREFAYVEPVIDATPVLVEMVGNAHHTEAVWSVPPTDELRYDEHLRLTEFLKNGGALSEHQQVWLNGYPKTINFRLIAEKRKKAS